MTESANTAADQPPFIEVPHTELAPDTLQAVLEEFINREGTDYGARELDLDAKLTSLRRQVDEGSVAILFDFETSSCTLVSRDEADELLRRYNSQLSAQGADLDH